MSEGSLTIEKFARWLTGLGILMAGLGCFSVYFIWWKFLPAPDVVHGYIFPLNDHGTTVYVSKAQFLASRYSWFVAAAGFALAIAGRKVRGKNVLGKWEE